MTATATGSTSSAGIDRYWLNLPDGWMRLDPAGERIPVQLARLLDELVERDPNAAEHRGQIERQLRAALREARSRELAFAAILSTFTPNGLPVAASLVMTVHDRPPGSDGSVILSSVGEQSAKTNSMISLPYVGSVVRSTFRDRVPVRLGSEPGLEQVRTDVAVFQYFLPTPSGREIVLVTGSTPTLPLAEVFGQLFDAIVSTFQFLGEG